MHAARLNAARRAVGALVPACGVVLRLLACFESSSLAARPRRAHEPAALRCERLRCSLSAGALASHALRPRHVLVPGKRNMPGAGCSTSRATSEPREQSAREVEQQQHASDEQRVVESCRRVERARLAAPRALVGRAASERDRPGWGVPPTLRGLSTGMHSTRQCAWAEMHLWILHLLMGDTR